MPIITLDSAIALTDLATAKTFLKAPADTSHDTIITMLINGASDFINRYCGNGGDQINIKAIELTEYHDGDGDLITPVNFPINSITAIYEDLDRLFPAASALSVADMIIVNQKRQIRYYANSFLSGYGSIKLVYNSGFAQVPYNAEMTCLEIIRIGYKDIIENRDGITSRTVGGGSVAIDGSRLPKHILQKLEPFMRKF